MRSHKDRAGAPGGKPSPDQPGVANRLSTEASFAPPLGRHWQPRGEARGYYIDFSEKAPASAWPPEWLRPFDELQVATVQWALGAWERYVRGQGEEWRAAAIGAAEHLISIQIKEGVREGAWLWWEPMPHTYRIDPPWASAIAQGEAASLFIRLHRETGEERFAEAAQRALRPLYAPTRLGGLMAEVDGGLPYFEEYPTLPASLVLNGGIFALWGLHDVATALGDADAKDHWEGGVAGLISLLERYDTGYWSRYDLYPHPVRNVASGAYHLLHINQLTVLHRLTSAAEFERTRGRFAAYRESRLNRYRAFASKAAFRLLLPRNRLLAQRTPFVNRARRRVGDRDLVVLCYHAVSEDWQDSLAVTPAQLERNLRHMLDAGYRPAQFSEAVLGPRVEKSFVVTFDDAFASVGRLARPILDRLGVPGTLFVPTAFPRGPGSMSWPGIDLIARGPHAAELEPMSWERISELAAAGWEIGSHTRRHPRLTELDDAELAAELLESRRDLERWLGSPCRAIAYPYGDNDERVARAAAVAGYAVGGTLPPPWSAMSLLSWPRVGIYPVDDDRRFRLKVSPLIRSLRRSRLGGVITAASRASSGSGGAPS
jgi:peptidoglycan/xylan/chitin deacetylase (PgdA/CDA1 family)